MIAFVPSYMAVYCSLLSVFSEPEAQSFQRSSGVTNTTDKCKVLVLFRGRSEASFSTQAWSAVWISHAPHRAASADHSSFVRAVWKASMLHFSYEANIVFALSVFALLDMPTCCCFIAELSSVAQVVVISRGQAWFGRDLTTTYWDVLEQKRKK